MKVKTAQRSELGLGDWTGKPWSWLIGTELLADPSAHRHGEAYDREVQRESSRKDCMSSTAIGGLYRQFSVV